MAICCANIHVFSVVYRRNTALRLFLILVLIRIFFCFEYLYVNNRMFPFW
jgi:hypothetical protein